MLYMFDCVGVRVIGH